jgi:hypothetical protein
MEVPSLMPKDERLVLLLAYVGEQNSSGVFFFQSFMSYKTTDRDRLCQFRVSLIIA